MEYCRFLRNLDFYLFFINSKVFFTVCIISFRNIFIICGEQSIRSEIQQKLHAVLLHIRLNASFL